MFDTIIISVLSAWIFVQLWYIIRLRCKVYQEIWYRKHLIIAINYAVNNCTNVFDAQTFLTRFMMQEATEVKIVKDVINKLETKYEDKEVN